MISCLAIRPLPAPRLRRKAISGCRFTARARSSAATLMLATTRISVTPPSVAINGRRRSPTRSSLSGISWTRTSRGSSGARRSIAVRSSSAIVGVTPGRSSPTTRRNLLARHCMKGQLGRVVSLGHTSVSGNKSDIGGKTPMIVTLSSCSRISRPMT